MSSKYARGNVVSIVNGVNLPIPAGTILIVRSVFTFGETKEDARKSFCHLNVSDETPVYFCSDCRSNTYFIPESYKDGENDVRTLLPADPVVEMNMILLDEIRNVKYLISKRGNYHRMHRKNNDADGRDVDGDSTPGNKPGLLERITKW